ncbi:hypothetical protein NIES2100_44880 [Calothrix sp. NIES-2100]|uniref:hypothetical protein n=1 Tax=Calothrix sp. NIES-2100 TaxID=1954172 RepID=UPI000B5F881C|nr:hypothetical protein NIES2100_44880 [Calothrix sp. NIES-2100]
MKNLNNLCAYPKNRPQAGSLGLLVQSLPLQAEYLEPAKAGLVRLAAPFYGDGGMAESMTI